jgi:predicted amidohydrolase YtcJ
MLTQDAAYAAFEEDIKGSIETGKLADLAVLSQDIMSIDEEEILNTEVLMTILDGKIIFTK